MVFPFQAHEGARPRSDRGVGRLRLDGRAETDGDLLQELRPRQERQDRRPRVAQIHAEDERCVFTYKVAVFQSPNIPL